MKLFLISFLFSLAVNIFAKEVNSIEQMFTNGEVTGQIRSMYASVDNKNTTDTYATALGGQLKYELGNYHGLSGGASFRSSHDINTLTGDGAKRNTSLSGTSNSYTKLSQAYLNFHYKELNIRAGRQGVDTHLADSDDIRMIPNTFEAYVLEYTLENFRFMFAHLKEWQGFDAGLTQKWQKLGQDGVNLLSLTYEKESFNFHACYIDISNPSMGDIAQGASPNANRSLYFEITKSIGLTNDTSLNIAIQHLHQHEKQSSGTKATIYGIITELSWHHLTLNFAYNKSLREEFKQSFSGYGGGALFTSLDNMILDNISLDREVDAAVLGCSYTLHNLNFYYMFGNYDGGKNAYNIKKHILEHNLGIDYTANDNLTFSTLLVKDENKQNPLDQNYNFINLRLLLTYNF